MGDRHSVNMATSIRLIACAVAMLVAQSTALPTKATTQDSLTLTAFDGTGKSFNWIEENDPIMGGQSTNCTFKKNDQSGVFAGTVELVPSLKAPGFCFARTLLTFSYDFPDASKYNNLEISFRAPIAYNGFKAAFLADTLNNQFGAFKADFNVSASPDLQKVTLPFASFTNKWSQFTGEPTAKSPPTDKNLKDISQLQIWAEGVKGPFELQIQSIAAM